ncbi:flagellin [Alishewanella longhuensis]
MALFVNTNQSSLNAQRQLLNSGNSLDVAFKRLSSGFRINSASDDAAGLQISNRLTSQINGLIKHHEMQTMVFPWHR